jgi:2-polyprenyl-3-methyl-5-hydroxy-6-metoxy-1,4-benzoquinol methylase
MTAEAVSGSAAGPLTDDEAARRDAFAERLLGAAIGMFDVLSVYLGVRLGLYRALHEGGAATPGDLARRAGCHERYVREWLEQQAVTGFVSVDETGSEAGQRRYALPREHAEVLLDRDSLNYMAPLARLIAGAASPLPALLDVYRNGGGVPFADYGLDVREGQAEMNRPMFLHQLPGEWLPAITDVHARLQQAEPPARVADVGCGAAWSAIGIARAYPNARVEGFDLDAASVALARQNVAEAGLADRVDIQLRDAGDSALAGQYDLVIALETVHDMSRPVEALRTMRRLVAPGGCVLIVDERVAETFAAPGDEIERMMYGWSILHCLPAGMADQPSAATGTVLRPATLRAYAQQAGFRDIAVLPIEHLFFRFYRLTQ